MVVKLIAIDLVIVIGISVVVGAIAPRIPARRLQRDAGLLVLMPWESVAFYRRLRTPWFAQRLPELGTMFGGQSKSVLPGTSPVELITYLQEVRRAEIVHWFSAFSWLPLIFFNPWWLTMAFAVIVTGGNALFLAILRFNRLRLLALLQRRQEGEPGG